MSEDLKVWRGKMEDYKRFGFILLAVSAFFYFGLLIRGTEQSSLQLLTIITASTTFMLLAGIFLYKSAIYKKKIDQLEEESM